MTVTIGLLGAGRIGLTHARTLANLPAARLAAIAEPSDAAAEAVTDLTEARRAEVGEIMADRAIDAVIIATPTDLHAAQVEQAARAGKVIFCEKPIDLDAARVRACLEVVGDTDTRLMIGFNRRFDSEFQALKQRIAAGAIGDIETIHLISRDHAPPPIAFVERSGGIFRDMMIHDLDMARFLMGEEFVEVFATGSVLIDPKIGAAGDLDTAAATLKTASGRIAVITANRRATYGHDQRAEVHGSKGMIAIANQRATSVTVADAGGYHRDPLLPTFTDRYAEAYRSEMTAFVDAVASGSPLSPDGEDGLRALELADAALRSSETGMTVRL
ncbi:MAG: inositol 2-dehydrogenase [Paracoccaceae bacterium]|nr:inositol 2-dehydrogenase [Paracoccaceae bacterium]